MKRKRINEPTNRSVPTEKTNHWNQSERTKWSCTKNGTQFTWIRAGIWILHECRRFRETSHLNRTNTKLNRENRPFSSVYVVEASHSNYIVISMVRYARVNEQIWRIVFFWSVFQKTASVFLPLSVASIRTCFRFLFSAFPNYPFMLSVFFDGLRLDWICRAHCVTW